MPIAPAKKVEMVRHPPARIRQTMASVAQALLSEALTGGELMFSAIERVLTIEAERAVVRGKEEIARSTLVILIDERGNGIIMSAATSAIETTEISSLDVE